MRAVIGLRMPIVKPGAKFARIGLRSSGVFRAAYRAEPLGQAPGSPCDHMVSVDHQGILSICSRDWEGRMFSGIWRKLLHRIEAMWGPSLYDGAADGEFAVTGHVERRIQSGDIEEPWPMCAKFPNLISGHARQCWLSEALKPRVEPQRPTISLPHSGSNALAPHLAAGMSAK